MSVPTFAAIYIYQSTAANLVAAASFAMVIFSSMDNGRKPAFPSLNYLSIAPILILFVFSRGLIGGYVLVFPYLDLAASIILSLSVFVWEIGLYYNQLYQTSALIRSKLGDNGYEEGEVEDELQNFSKYFSRNARRSLAISIVAFAAVYILPKISAEIFVLLIIFLVAYLLLARYVIRDVPRI